MGKTLMDPETTSLVAPPIDGEVEKGTIADTRRAPVVDPGTLWKPPATYRALDSETVRGLSKISDGQKAELELAAQQVINTHSTMRTRFGEAAPDTSAMAGLWKRYQDAEAAWDIAQAQATYWGDVARVAQHDILRIIDLVDETVRGPASRNTQIANDFSAVLKISDQRSQAIREGRARARAERQPSGDPVAVAPPARDDSTIGPSTKSPPK